MNTQAQVVRNSPLMRDGWKSVFHWGVAGALLAFAGIGMMSIGWFIMPFAVWAFYHASARYRFFPEGISGALLGASAVILFIAFLHRGDVPCPSSGSIIVFRGDRGSCGGLDPMPWLRVGLTVMAIGIATYCVGFWARSRRRTA